MARDIEEFVLFETLHSYFKLILIQSGKNILCGYSQTDYHLIYLANIHRSSLIYFRMFNMLKILPNRNCLKHCVFHWRMLHLVFPYNNQFLISYRVAVH